ncbi:MAG TPA: hypothetical protein VFG53_10630 [Anaeromyxobacter sp.]|nr:hypothetical protein [Anaeromyxobacter sp.]
MERHDLPLAERHEVDEVGLVTLAGILGTTPHVTDHRHALLTLEKALNIELFDVFGIPADPCPFHEARMAAPRACRRVERVLLAR